jgi:hypothetical protein
VQLCEVFNLVDWVRGRRRILHSGIVDRRLVIRLLLLLLGSVMSDGPSGHRTSDQRTTPCPSPHAHREILPTCSANYDPAGRYAGDTIRVPDRATPADTTANLPSRNGGIYRGSVVSIGMSRLSDVNSRRGTARIRV